MLAPLLAAVCRYPSPPGIRNSALLSRDWVSSLVLAISVETASRELDYKLFLAVSALPWAGSTVVGRLDVLVRVARHVDELTFVGKLFPSTFPQASLHRLEAIKRAGWRVVYLEEEGAFFPDALGPTLDRRLDPNVLDESDVVCCWGRLQTEHYASATSVGGPRSVTVGCPRFDLLSEKYAPYFDVEILGIQERLGSFYLINTSFGLANHGSSAFGRLGPKPDFRPQEVTDVIEWVDSVNAIAETHRSVAELSRRHPELTFVVRPHPSEHLSGYSVLHGLPNVTIERTGPVFPWILASRGLLHGGCTTAVEALLGRRPVVALDVKMPDVAGTLAVLQGLGEPYAADVLERLAWADEPAVPHRTLSDLADLIDNFNEPSLPRINELLRIEGQSQRPPNPRRLRTAVRLAGGVSSLAWLGSDLRRRVSPARERHFVYSASKFPGFGQLKLEDRLGRVSYLLGIPAKLTYASRDLALIESA